MDVVRRIGAKVRELRKAQGLSQEELAARAGLDRTYISQIERGVKNVTVASLDKVAQALGATLVELVA